MVRVEDEDLHAKVARLEHELETARAGRLMADTILATVPAVVSRLSLDLEIEVINRVPPGYERAKIIGESVFAFAPPDQHATMRQAFETAKATRQPTTVESMGEASDGTRDWFFTTVGPIIDGDEVVGLTLISTNVTRMKRVEAELRESRARLEVALDAGRVGLWRWDAVRDVVDWDNRLCAMFGLSPDNTPRVRADWLALIPPDLRERMDAHIDEALRTGIYPDFELPVGPASSRRWFIVRGGPMIAADGSIIGLMGGVLEVTSLRRLEEQVQQTQRLEAVGQLASGIAHNFNNMLAAIVPVLELAKRRMPPAEQDFVEPALQSALQAANLVKELMAFSRRGTEEPGEAESLDLVIRRAVDLCERTFEQRVRIELGELSAARGVAVDGARTEHALLNLLVNARDAVEGLDASRRTVTLSARALSKGALGRCIEIRVTDRGNGMDEVTLRRIFDPFFTTKPIGKGTGLGVPTAWAAAKAQRGDLTCESTLGVGTSFILTLPAVPDAAAMQRDRLMPSPFSRASVLVIDDEPHVLQSTMMLLEILGHRPLGARSGEEGVRVAQAETVDVVVLDRSMPGQPPEATLAQLRAMSPDLPVIAFSGLGDELAGATVQLAKPATAGQLERALATALASRGTLSR
jgi:signal transduction histidine kinase/CheY-like chemotaxis protein